jgi:hypothetical protein
VKKWIFVTYLLTLRVKVGGIFPFNIFLYVNLIPFKSYIKLPTDLYYPRAKLGFKKNNRKPKRLY